MSLLLHIAGGDTGLVDRAFLEAKRDPPDQPPAIEEVIFYILRARGMGHLVDQIKKSIEKDAPLTKPLARLLKKRRR